MSILEKSKRLKKELSLLNIYTIATGATIASGFFLLPGLAAAQAGPAVILSYLIATIPVIPALFTQAELATAMPRAGGVYYFLDRSMGPLWGTIGGLGTWMALELKAAFALVGIGAYLNLFIPGIPVKPLAIAFALLFGYINLSGARKTGIFQSILVGGLLILLLWFAVTGAGKINFQHFQGIFDQELGAILSTAGLVYVSYVGLTKIASVSEEVKNPEKNIPLAMFLALATAVLVYVVGTFVMVGVIPAEEFHHDLTPVATAARLMEGQWGAALMTVAAVLAFFSVANAGIMSASRYPLAMSRDHLLPRFFRFLTKQRTPRISIYVTVGLIVLCLVFFEPTRIAKLAGTFQLLLFSLNSLALIVMRESHIVSYDPGYRSPLYPWMQIFGFLAPIWLIIEMGWLPMLFSLGLIAVGTAWYFYYAKERVRRGGAIYHIFARLGEKRFEGLDRELRGILKEKGLREKDPFDAVIAGASVIDLTLKVSFEEIVQRASNRLAKQFAVKKELLVESFMQGTRVGATPVSHGVALPHLRLPGLPHPEIVIVRSRIGVTVEVDEELLGEHASASPVYAFFFLVSPEENPAQHLRILAQIADHVDDETFMKRWLSAKNEQDMKELLLRGDRYLSIDIKRDSRTAHWIGQAVSTLNLPPESLIALIHRNEEIIIPRGRTVLKEGDRLTIIGDPDGIEMLYRQYAEER